jgi:hypothetical protein
VAELHVPLHAHAAKSAGLRYLVRRAAVRRAPHRAPSEPDHRRGEDAHAVSYDQVRAEERAILLDGCGPRRLALLPPLRVDRALQRDAAASDDRRADPAPTGQLEGVRADQSSGRGGAGIVEAPEEICAVRDQGRNGLQDREAEPSAAVLHLECDHRHADADLGLLLHPTISRENLPRVVRDDAQERKGVPGRSVCMRQHHV